METAGRVGPLPTATVGILVLRTTTEPTIKGLILLAQLPPTMEPRASGALTPPRPLMGTLLVVRPAIAVVMRVCMLRIAISNLVLAVVVEEVTPVASKSSYFDTLRQKPRQQIAAVDLATMQPTAQSPVSSLEIVSIVISLGK